MYNNNIKFSNSELAIIKQGEYFRYSGFFINDLPVAYSWMNPTGSNILSLCPYCGCLHQHGKPQGGREEHRLSHCINRDISGTYYLKLLDGIPPLEVLQSSKLWYRYHVKRDPYIRTADVCKTDATEIMLNNIRRCRNEKI